MTEYESPACNICGMIPSCDNEAFTHFINNHFTHVTNLTAYEEFKNKIIFMFYGSNLTMNRERMRLTT